MMQNDTPADTGDDFIAILGTVSNGPRAGYPQLTIPMGYNTTQRRTLNVSIHGNAYNERDLIGVAYVIEQATKLRKPVSEINPSMYRCAHTVAGSGVLRARLVQPGLRVDDEADRRRRARRSPFSLETESAKSLQDRMTAGTLSAETLTKAYLARIALTNAEGPALQAVRALNTHAIEEAKLLDRERATSGVRGPLHGIPVLLDDVIDAKGLPTTGGSIALQKSMPGVLTRRWSRSSRPRARSSSARPTSPSSTGSSTPTCRRATRRSAARCCCRRTPTRRRPAPPRGSAAATAEGLAALTVGLESSTDSAQIIAPAGVAGVVALKPTRRPGLERRRPAGREVPGRRRPDRQDGVRRGRRPRRADGRQLRHRSRPTALAGKKVAVIGTPPASVPDRDHRLPASARRPSPRRSARRRRTRRASSTGPSRRTSTPTSPGPPAARARCRASSTTTPRTRSKASSTSRAS